MLGSRSFLGRLALERLLHEAAAVVSAGGEELTVPLSQLDALWTRDAVFYWPEPAEARASAEGRDAWGRQALSGLGIQDPVLATAVSRFQESAELVPDGLLGSRTRMALYARSTSARPRLATGEGGR